MVQLIIELLGLAYDQISDTVKLLFYWLARLALLAFLCFGLGYAFGWVSLLKLATFLLFVLAIAIGLLIISLRAAAVFAQKGFAAVQFTWEMVCGLLFWVSSLALLFALPLLWEHPLAIVVFFFVVISTAAAAARFGIKVNPRWVWLRNCAILFVTVACILLPSLAVAGGNLRHFLDEAILSGGNRLIAPERIGYDLDNIDRLDFFDRVMPDKVKIFYIIREDGEYELYNKEGIDASTGERLQAADRNTKARIKAYLKAKKAEIDKQQAEKQLAAVVTTSTIPAETTTTSTLIETVETLVLKAEEINSTTLPESVGPAPTAIEYDWFKGSVRDNQTSQTVLRTQPTYLTTTSSLPIKETEQRYDRWHQAIADRKKAAQERLAVSKQLESIELPVETTLIVVLDDGLSSSFAQPEGIFATHLARAIGEIAIGTPISGWVVQANPAGQLGQKARLELALYQIQINRQSQRIETTTLAFEASPEIGKKVAISIGTGIIGALIGRAVGGGKGAAVGGAGGSATALIVTKGKEVDLPAGTKLAFQLTKSLILN